MLKATILYQTIPFSIIATSYNEFADKVFDQYVKQSLYLSRTTCLDSIREFIGVDKVSNTIKKILGSASVDSPTENSAIPQTQDQSDLQHHPCPP